MPWRDLYDTSVKPSWTPKPVTTGMFWKIIYPIIPIAFGYVVIQVTRKKVPWKVVLPLGINFVAPPDLHAKSVRPT